jgi:hypothetical protein
MKFMLLIHQGTTPLPGTKEWDGLSEDEQKQVYADYQAVNQTPGVTPADVRMDSPETAVTVRVEDGKPLRTDGPFAETKEALGGYLFYEADSMDAAVELASKIPAARMGGGIEIRPLV